MARTIKQLLKEWPTAPFIMKATLVAPSRNQMLAEMRFDDVERGYLVMMLLATSGGRFTGRKRKAVLELLAAMRVSEKVLRTLRAEAKALKQHTPRRAMPGRKKTRVAAKA